MPVSGLQPESPSSASTAMPMYGSATAMQQSPLLTPAVDALMIGGASVLVFAFSYLYVDKGASTVQISWTAFYLAMLINNPHFMASYAMLYWDKRKELLRRPRLFWAAVLVPCLLLGYLAYGIASASPQLLGFAVNAMFFLVGWHYVKQIYGCMVVTSVRRGFYLSKGESWALKLNLYPLWFMSFFNANGGVRDLVHYGVGYQTWAFPVWMSTLNYGVFAISMVCLGAVFFRKWIREGQLPGLAAVCSLAAIYVWYLPSLYHAHFWYLIPFFHSLQYLLFVFAYKKNQFAAAAQAQSGTDESKRKFFAKNYLGFLGIIVAAGALCFHAVPALLDRYISYDRSVFGVELFAFLFITFINIHHYFIDSVLWRRDNAELKRFLFAPKT